LPPAQSGAGPKIVRIPRRATGTIIEKRGRGGNIVRALRFSAYGKRRYLTLGSVSAGEAERELRRVLADVERGTWRVTRLRRSVQAPVAMPVFRAFAAEWWLRGAPPLAAVTQRGYRWRLNRHLLPYFGALRLDQITGEVVERYIAAKLTEPEPLSATSINMTLALLGAILESAVARELLVRNPARGHRVRARRRVLNWQ
jgi:Phage integrase, N-terminal SAM-like domain